MLSVYRPKHLTIFWTQLYGVFLMKKLFFILAFVALSFGCATQTYYINGDAQAVPKTQEMQPFFVSGLGQTQEINATEICGGSENVAKVQSKDNFIDILLGVLTSGIYTPRTAIVYCVAQ